MIITCLLLTRYQDYIFRLSQLLSLPVISNTPYSKHFSTTDLNREESVVPFAVVYISSVAHLSNVNENITINLNMTFVMSFPLRFLHQENIRRYIILFRRIASKII